MSGARPDGLDVASEGVAEGEDDVVAKMKTKETVMMMAKTETKAMVKTTMKEDGQKTMKMNDYGWKDSSLPPSSAISLPQFPKIARAPALTSSADETLSEVAVGRPA